MAYLATKHRFEIAPDSGWRSFTHLRKSLLRHADELAALLQRPAQVNDPLRCVALYPGLVHVARQVCRPIALVEVGPSLGLNLCMDRYAYEYTPVGSTGAPDSGCRLMAEVDDLASRARSRRRRAFRLPETPPLVGERIGLELNPVSLDTDSIAWMRAFHFPKSEDRFDAALAIRLNTPLRILEGDAADTLAEGLSLVPDDQVPLVFQTAVAYQMSDAVRERLMAQLAQAALQRRVMYMTWAEETARRGALLQVTDLNLAEGTARRSLLGFVGRWEPVPKLEWVYSG